MSQLLRSVARRLRYRTLTDVIDKSLVVHNLQNICQDVIPALSPAVPLTATLVGPPIKYLAGSLATYNFIDLTFSTPDLAPGESDAKGIILLKELGFIDTSPLDDEANETDGLPDDDLECLQQLDEELATDQSLVRLFLVGTEFRKTGYTVKPNRPENSHLPQTFTVLDACVTNADFVWFLKHFYW